MYRSGRTGSLSRITFLDYGNTIDSRLRLFGKVFSHITFHQPVERDDAMQANFYVRKNAYSGLPKTDLHNTEKIYEKKDSCLYSATGRLTQNHCKVL